MPRPPDTRPIDDPWYRRYRLSGLRTFGVVITLFNVAGHLFLGFEQSWATPIVAVLTAYLAEAGLEAIDAWACSRRPRYAGGLGSMVDFLLPGHITGLACGMLLYPNERLGPIVFAVVVAIASKTLLRAAVGRARRHVFNPSNLGITVVLLLFPWVGIAPPYQFTENIHGLADWALPAAIVVGGTALNAKVTGRVPLIVAWLLGFAAQGVLRSYVFGSQPAAALVPMTGVAFVLFTFYMLTDPATTPSDRRGQVAFGLAVAATYGALMALHVVFGLFFALTLVCAGRWMWLVVREAVASSLPEARVPSLAPTLTGRSGSSGVGSGASPGATRTT